jgi:hypothetical protein
MSSFFLKIKHMKPLTLSNLQDNTALSKHGVYTIYICDSYGKPVPINRLCGEDKEGRLYIGAAEKTALSYRLMAFIHSMNPDRRQNNHSAGVKIFNNLNLQKWLKQNTLYFDVHIALNAKTIEKDALEKYKDTFGEVPPLNG